MDRWHGRTRFVRKSFEDAGKVYYQFRKWSLMTAAIVHRKGVIGGASIGEDGNGDDVVESSRSKIPVCQTSGRVVDPSIISSVTIRLNSPKVSQKQILDSVQQIPVNVSQKPIPDSILQTSPKSTQKSVPDPVPQISPKLKILKLEDCSTSSPILPQLTQKSKIINLDALGDHSQAVKIQITPPRLNVASGTLLEVHRTSPVSISNVKIIAPTVLDSPNESLKGSPILKGIMLEISCNSPKSVAKSTASTAVLPIPPTKIGAFLNDDTNVLHQIYEDVTSVKVKTIATLSLPKASSPILDDLLIIPKQPFKITARPLVSEVKPNLQELFPRASLSLKANNLALDNFSIIPKQSKTTTNQPMSPVVKAPIVISKIAPPALHESIQIEPTPPNSTSPMLHDLTIDLKRPITNIIQPLIHDIKAPAITKKSDSRKQTVPITPTLLGVDTGNATAEKSSSNLKESNKEFRASIYSHPVVTQISPTKTSALSANSDIVIPLTSIPRIVITMDPIVSPSLARSVAFLPDRLKPFVPRRRPKIPIRPISTMDPSVIDLCREAADLDLVRREAIENVWREESKNIAERVAIKIRSDASKNGFIGSISEVNAVPVVVAKVIMQELKCPSPLITQLVTGNVVGDSLSSETALNATRMWFLRWRLSMLHSVWCRHIAKDMKVTVFQSWSKLLLNRLEDQERAIKTRATTCVWRGYGMWRKRIWILRGQEGVAGGFQDFVKMRVFFGNWRIRRESVATLRIEEILCVQKAFLDWKRHATVIVAVRMHELQHVRDYFLIWKQCLEDGRNNGVNEFKATRFHEFLCARAAILKWKKCMELSTASKMHGYVCIQSAFLKWRHEVEDAKDGINDIKAIRFNEFVNIRNSIAKWRRQTGLLVASRMHEYGCLQSAFLKWRQRITDGENEVKASVYHEYVCVRASVLKWRIREVHTKADRFRYLRSASSKFEHWNGRWKDNNVFGTRESEGVLMNEFYVQRWAFSSWKAREQSCMDNFELSQFFLSYTLIK